MAQGQIWQNFPKLLRFVALFPSLSEWNSSRRMLCRRGVLTRGVHGKPGHGSQDICTLKFEAPRAPSTQQPGHLNPGTLRVAKVLAINRREKPRKPERRRNKKDRRKIHQRLANTITHKMITEPNFIIFELFSVIPALWLPNRTVSGITGSWLEVWAEDFRIRCRIIWGFLFGNLGGGITEPKWFWN